MKVENAKKMPATRPAPSAAKTVSAGSKASIASPILAAYAARELWRR
jgi:hypothetical protein